MCVSEIVWKKVKRNKKSDKEEKNIQKRKHWTASNWNGDTCFLSIRVFFFVSFYFLENQDQRRVTNTIKFILASALHLWILCKIGGILKKWFFFHSTPICLPIRIHSFPPYTILIVLCVVFCALHLLVQSFFFGSFFFVFRFVHQRSVHVLCIIIDIEWSNIHL